MDKLLNYVDFIAKYDKEKLNLPYVNLYKEFFNKKFNYKDDTNDIYITPLMYYLLKTKSTRTDLIDAIYSIEKDNYNYNNLMFYLGYNPDPNEKIVKYFINSGESSSIERSSDGYTALTIYLGYCKNPRIEIVKLLGHLRGHYDSKGQTALFTYAGYNRYPDKNIISFLKESEKEKNHRDTKGQTPLMQFIRYTIPDILKNIKEIDDNKRKDYIDIVKLLSYNSNVKDNFDKTAKLYFTYSLTRYRKKLSDDDNEFIQSILMTL